MMHGGVYTMVTVYYIDTKVPTYPMRHRLKDAGCKWDASQSKWWAASEGDAHAAATQIIGGSDWLIRDVELPDYPKGKPRGRPFKPGNDARRERMGGDGGMEDGNDDNDTHHNNGRDDKAATQLAALVRQ